MKSANFDYLKHHNEQLFRLGYLAERFFAEDPNTSLIKSRQFAELLTKEVAARAGAYDPKVRENFNDLLYALKRDRIMSKAILDVVHAIRIKGNKATHEFGGTHAEALTALKFARALGVWFHQGFGNAPDFKPGPFVPPPDPSKENADLQATLEELRRKVRDAERAAQSAEASAEELQRAREAAEQLAQQAHEDRANWEALAHEFDDERARLERELAALNTQAEAAPEQERKDTVSAGLKAAESLELDEADTRTLIDVQLIDIGWEVDSKTLRYVDGVRPTEGRNLAISEWPTETGPVDYALFVGKQCVGVIEAKRESKDIAGILNSQTKRYAKSISLGGDELLADAPWVHDDATSYRVPFLFATNGRPFVRQFIEKSGIWFLDARKASNHPVALPEWFSPADLVSKLEQDVGGSAEQLAQESFDYAGLRPYQQEAITAIEEAIGRGQREALIAMATGTGKTRTCIALMYRLLKHKRFRRILFLVDRKALGNQTLDALENTELEGLLKFAQIYNVANLETKIPEKSDQVHVATVQSLVSRIMTEGDPDQRVTPGMYDCIIVDEAHRGYTLDAELREGDVGFRDVDDYLSKYRQVLDYFDATKVALTATPALHTTEIFGRPVYNYSYRQAVIDGFLTDHLPPKRILTALAEAGIKFEGGEEVEIIDPRSGEVELSTLDDTVELEVEKFNKKVYTENFNKVVCEALATEIDPSAPGKTLIFAARDDHADRVVRLLKDALKEEWGDIPDDLVMKITGSVDKPEKQIRRFRSDPLPKIVVTVDLLTTGIDIPSITNLVFLRRVNSRILYDQMLGRATRLCKEIGKEHFRIFDAVDLYSHLQELSDMRPVVVRPNISLMQLVNDLKFAPTEEDQEWVAGQIVVKTRQLIHRMDEGQRSQLETHLDCAPDDLADSLHEMSPAELLDWFEHFPRTTEVLDRKPSGRGGNGIYVSEHDDELIGIEDYFGENASPEDYIEGFERFVKKNMNTVPALIAATQKPRDLTRKELASLAKLLDDEGFSEANLRAAYGRVRNADIAAHIIGYVRQAALGDPLVPYATRVDNAIAKIGASRTWNSVQKRWLKRIGRVLKETPVADPTTLEAGAFAQQGGYRRISMDFAGELPGLLQELNAAIWETPAA
ncbi:MAG: type I restriction-modification system endonuclease [Pseudomonadota bacterium]|nr:type I restriction-modification system endonuclease [Pseudomonadota bacterium]